MTFIPCLILVIIAIPSFYFLYIVEENLKTLLTVKATVISGIGLMITFN